MSKPDRSPGFYPKPERSPSQSHEEKLDSIEVECQEWLDQQKLTHEAKYALERIEAENKVKLEAFRAVLMEQLEAETAQKKRAEEVELMFDESNHKLKMLVGAVVGAGVVGLVVIGAIAGVGFILKP